MRFKMIRGTYVRLFKVTFHSPLEDGQAISFMFRGLISLHNKKRSYNIDIAFAATQLYAILEFNKYIFNFIIQRPVSR